MLDFEETIGFLQVSHVLLPMTVDPASEHGDEECRIIGVPQGGSGAAIDDPIYLQPKIFQLRSVSRIFQQYEGLLYRVPP